MCFCHVERACARRFNGNEGKDNIILDLQSIQLAFSKPLIISMIELFKSKCSKYQEFINNLINEWVHQN